MKTKRYQLSQTTSNLRYSCGHGWNHSFGGSFTYNRLKLLSAVFLLEGKNTGFGTIVDLFKEGEVRLVLIFESRTLRMLASALPWATSESSNYSWRHYKYLKVQVIGDKLACQFIQSKLCWWGWFWRILYERSELTIFMAFPYSVPC